MRRFAPLPCLFLSPEVSASGAVNKLGLYFKAMNAPPATMALPSSTPPANVDHLESVVVDILQCLLVAKTSFFTLLSNNF
jgi:hypothetical protein